MRCTGLALVAAIGLAASPARAVTIEAVKSPGGITAWLVEDHSIPVVSMHAAFRGGAALDTGDKAGLANFVASLLDEGAGDLDSTSFQSKLEDLAGSLGFDVSRDNFMLRLRSPAGNVGPVFDLLRLALTSPRFDDGPVARFRAEIIDALARDQRLPVGIASRIWWQTEFPNHAYGRSILGTRASVAGITAEDMRGWLHTRLAKDTLVVAVVGDIAPANLRLLLDKTFGDLPDHAAPAALAEAVPRRLSEVLVNELADTAKRRRLRAERHPARRPRLVCRVARSRHLGRRRVDLAGRAGRARRSWSGLFGLGRARAAARRRLDSGRGRQPERQGGGGARPHPRRVAADAR